MVEQFNELAGLLEGQGFHPAAQRTLKLKDELKSEELIPATLTPKAQIGIDIDKNLLKPERVFYHPGFTFYPERSSVIVDGTDTHLTKIENGILELLIKNPNRVFSSKVILEKVWGPEYTEVGLVKWHVRTLRRKLEPKAKKNSEFVYLIGIRDSGYRLVTPDAPQIPLSSSPVSGESKTSELSPEKIFYHSGFTYFPERSLVRIYGKDVNLSKTENAILWLMAAKPNRVISHSSFTGIFDPDKDFAASTPELVKWHIKNIRNKLEPKDRGVGGFRSQKSCIRTISGIGYKLVDPSAK